MKTNLVKALATYLNADKLTFSIMALRACIVYCAAMVLVRVAKQRLMGKYTALDLVVLLMLGSLLGGSIINMVPFFSGLAVALVLVVLHWVFCALTYYSNTAGKVLKGRSYVLVENGTINWKNLCASYITENDLMSALRSNGQLTDVSDVKLALLERNGHISVIPHERTPRIVEMAFEKDIQKVVIEFK